MDFSFDEEIILENERALLRPLALADVRDLLPAASETENLVQFSPFYIHTEEHLQTFIENSMNERKNGFRYAFTIYDKKAAAFAGSTSIANVSNKDLRFEIGWTWIARKFQQTGLNRNCKFLLLQYAFETLGFERVEFRTDERNRQSRNAMEKMGAVYEGALRSHTLMLDGFRRTTIYYSILKPEWEKLKPGFLK